MLIYKALLFIGLLLATATAQEAHSLIDNQQPFESSDEKPLELLDVDYAANKTDNSTDIDDNGTTTEPPVSLGSTTTPSAPAKQSFTFFLKLSIAEFVNQKSKFTEELKNRLKPNISYSAYAVDGCKIDATAKEVEDDYLEVTVTLSGCKHQDKTSFESSVEAAVKTTYDGAEFYTEMPTSKTGLEMWQIIVIVIGAVVVVLILAGIGYRISRRNESIRNTR